MARKNVSLSGFDRDYRYRWDIRRLAGVDEAGRGCLAGPVVAAAVILEPGRIIRGLNDSKQLAVEKRQYLFHKICEHALGVAIGWASAEEIDRVNILRATHLAARRALEILRPVPQGILTDYLKLELAENLPLDAIVKGDGRSQSIAAASVIAKVSRDRWMKGLDGEFPGYGMARHKGYGTPQHVGAIQRLGSSTLHRQ
ncbi:MAG: ribonuclease HII, partial [Candidatus Sumerlaeota bacterium]